MEYELILIIILLEWMDALVPRSAIYSISGLLDKNLIIFTNFSFDEVSLKSEENLAVIILMWWSFL